MAVLRPNNVGDPVGNVNAITLTTPTTTTAIWPAAPFNMPAVNSPDILKVICEPNTTREEITYVTAYTPGATSATVLRAQEGSVGTAHSAVNWVCGPTNADFASQVYTGPTPPNPRGEYTLWVDTSTPSPGPIYPGMILNSVQYGPSGLIGYQLTQTMAASDTVNLTISFTAPLSGRVMLQATIFTRVLSSTTQGAEACVEACFLNHGTTTPVSPAQRLIEINAVAAASNYVSAICTYRALVTGLTPGTTYQYDWAGLYFLASGTGGGGYFYVDNGATYSGGTNVGPALLTVSAA